MRVVLKRRCLNRSAFFALNRAIALIITVTVSWSPIAYSGDAAVLPKGRWRLLVDTHFIIPFDRRYDREGNAVLYAEAFNKSLDSTVFSALPPGASLGRSIVSFERHITESYIQPAYGVTDKLSIGLIIPYFWYENRVSASIDTSTATVGINSAVPGGIAPLNIPGTRRATTEDIEKVLRTQFGIERVETWRDEGLGDIVAGAKYQYLTTEQWRLAFTGGIRFPTGHVDDPNNLVDSSFGRGAYAFLFQFQQDFMRQSPGLAKRLGFPNPGEFFINTTFRYELNLPDKQTLRVCPGPDNPFCNTLDDVRRKVGDTIEAEIAPKIGFLIPGLNFAPMYKYGYKFKDHHTGDKPLDYGSLSESLDQVRTTYTEHTYFITVNYSTVPLYAEKRFPVPASVGITYRNRFDGSGGLGKSQFIGLVAQVFF